MAKKEFIDPRERLIGLGAEALADALLDLGGRYAPVSKRIDRLVETPDEKLKRVKAKISGLKRAKRFVSRRESSEFAADLLGVLEDIHESVRDPKNGLLLTASFFETDEAVISRCDDSDGIIGDVYRIDARKLFTEYGAAEEDKESVANLIFRLNLKDDYGLRDTLVDHAGDMLGEPEIRGLIRMLLTSQEKETSNMGRFHALLNIESLAKQIGDAELFEQTALTRVESPYPKLWIEIARVYLTAGDPDKALDRLSKIEECREPYTTERDRLLSEIYRVKGWSERRAELLRNMFRQHRSVELLNEIALSIGEERRDELVGEAVDEILCRVGFDFSDLQFLLDCDKKEQAELYLSKRADFINDEAYYHWLPIVEKMERGGLLSSATLIYRALLLEILENANYAAYGHGARYLRKLDRLAEQIGDWKNTAEHQLFKEKIGTDHKRKTSFRAKYESAK
ncbi:MAG: hypothetical protein GXY06_02380 [Clostridiaceae bacterium]|nr:hypothetical protein [Clostridiaceae bacterium]